MSNRGKLLKVFSARSFSIETQIMIASTFRGLDEGTKEKWANHLIALIAGSETERDVLEWLKHEDVMLLYS